jgi:uncharacterized protein (DUF1330 family)
MAAYVIANVDVKDLVMFEEYRKLVGPTVETFGGKYRVRGGKAEKIEGNWEPKRVVVLEFESLERAKQWYNSPEYIKAMEVRHKAATADVIFVEGV